MTEPVHNFPGNSPVDNLQAYRGFRSALEKELSDCEARAIELRKELGLVAQPKTEAPVVHNTTVHVNGSNGAATTNEGPDLHRAVRKAIAKLPKARAAAKAKPKSDRLPRRTPEQVEVDVARIVGLVKKAKDGLRAEQIKERLGFQVKEMPRLLKEGVKKKLLKRKGQKRATSYSAA